VTAARRTDAIALAILSSILTLFFIDVLAGYNALYLRDITHYYYPAKHVLREIVLGGEFPYWNPLLAAGQPMAANPEHEVFYPLTWLILLPSYDLGFRLLLVLHVHICAWTMYAFLRTAGVPPAAAAASRRREGRRDGAPAAGGDAGGPLSPPAAFLGALSFALGGVVLSNLTLLPILFVLAWLPLTCLYTRRFLLERRPRDFALAALSLGLQMLVGEPTTVAQTGFLLGAYAIALGIRRRSARPLLAVALISLAALCVAAAMVIPGVDHAADSVRSRGFAFQFVTTWSMPPARIAELVFPNVFGHHNPDRNLYWGGRLYGERGTPFFLGFYPGLFIAAMLLTGLVVRVRGWKLTASILAASWLLAIGHHTPLWQWLYDAGLARSVRYPEKFVLMGIFAATVFAVRVFDQLLEGDARVRRAALRVSAVIAGIAALFAIAALTPAHPRLFIALWKPRPAELAEMLVRSRSSWIVAALFATLFALLVRNLPRERRQVWLALATLFVLLDLGLLFPELAPRMPASYFTEPPPLERRFPKERDDWRLMHAIEWQSSDPTFRPFMIGPELYWIRRNALRPMTPARWGIRTVMEMDYDQTALLPTSNFVEVIDWLARGRPDWPALIAPMTNARFLGTYDDPARALARVHGDRHRVQPVQITSLGAHPRYSFAQQVIPVRDLTDFAGLLAGARTTRGVAYTFGRAEARPASGVVRNVRETANSARIEVETAGDAFLVMSVTPHKYWRVTIDGAEAEAVVVNAGFQGVSVPAGRHVVEMRYRNPLIAVGAAISLSSLLALAFITMRRL
jgi:hypothetical protein